MSFLSITPIPLEFDSSLERPTPEGIIFPRNHKRGIFSCTETTITTTPDIPKSIITPPLRPNYQKPPSLTSIDEILTYQPRSMKCDSTTTLGSCPMRKFSRVLLDDSAFQSTKAVIETDPSIMIDDDILVKEDRQSRVLRTLPDVTPKSGVTAPSLIMIKESCKGILQNGKVLNAELRRAQRERRMADEAYLKSLEHLRRKIDNPSYGFNYWKINKPFLRERAKLREKVDKFRVESNEIIKEAQKLRELDHYMVMENGLDHNAGTVKFNEVEELLLKEPKPFRTKPALSRKEQCEMRLKALNNRHEPGYNIKSSKEKTDHEKSKQPRSTKTSLRLNIDTQDIKNTMIMDVIAGNFSDKSMAKYLPGQRFQSLDACSENSRQTSTINGDVVLTDFGEESYAVPDKENLDYVPVTNEKITMRLRAIKARMGLQNYKEDYSVFRKMSLLDRIKKGGSQLR